MVKSLDIVGDCIKANKVMLKQLLKLKQNICKEHNIKIKKSCKKKVKFVKESPIVETNESIVEVVCDNDEINLNLC